MALGTTLPPWPALVFAYLEPVSVLLGFHAAVFHPSTFIATQLPSPVYQPHPAAIMITYTLGNLFLVMAGMAILCTFITRDPRITKWYLVILACGDIGHLWACYSGMGKHAFWDFREYNAMMYGNVVFTFFLHINRQLTLFGLFGRI